MSKSYQDYDKVTVSDRILSLLRVFVLGVLGALVGSLPAVILLCFFNISAGLLYLLTGCGSMVFYGMFLKKEDRRWPDHIALILSMSIGVYISQFVSYMLHYAPLWDLEGQEMNRFQKALFAYFRHVNFDQLTLHGIVTSDGAFSVYTVLISSLVIALIGMYATFLFVLANDREGTEKESKKKKGRRHE